MEEYDFRRDQKNASLNIDQRATTKIRTYQEKSLRKIFGNGRARSGIIVLPCGAGKSLTGITVAQTIKKCTMVMCINNASVNQWKNEFKKYTTVQESCIRFFMSGHVEQLPVVTAGRAPEACIVITTYRYCGCGRSICVRERQRESMCILNLK